MAHFPCVQTSVIISMISVGCNETSVEKDKGRSFFSRLFRSKPTEQKKKPQKFSSSQSTKSSESAPKRRFVRVIRDNEHTGEEYENPHVIRRYTKSYWEENNQRMACSLDDSRGSLPYTVSGHTILKKHSFEDNNCLAQKKATFNSEVEIFMFNHLEKTGACKRMTRSMPHMTFDDESHCEEAKQSVDCESASGDEDNCVDYVVPEELTENLSDDSECQVVAESHDDFPGSDSDQSSDSVTGGRFASLVAADEKDMHATRVKRKLSSSSGSSESSCQLALEA